MSLFPNRKFSTPAILILAAALAACGGGAQEQTGAPPPPEVAVQTVEPGDVAVSATLPGRTSAYAVAQVRPQVSGLIAERLFTEGDAVSAGQPLYRLDAAPYEAAYESARAALARAEALAAAAIKKEARYNELVEHEAVSLQNQDDAVAAAGQARADVAAARAALGAAKVDLDRTVVTAPIDGRIGRSFVTVGALVTANQAQELSIINALDPIYVDVAQSSADILRMKRRLATGDASAADETLPVALTLEDGGAYAHKGRLELTEVSVDPSTGSVTLRAVFPNPENLLMPGMFVRAEIVEGRRSGAILVPQKAVARNPQGEGYVIVVDAENKTEQRIVETERAVGDQWVLAGGLEPNERIVVEGFQRFRPGDAVTPIDASQLAAAESLGAGRARGGL